MISARDEQKSASGVECQSSEIRAADIPLRDNLVCLVHQSRGSSRCLRHSCIKDCVHQPRSLPLNSPAEFSFSILNAMDWKHRNLERLGPGRVASRCWSRCDPQLSRRGNIDHAVWRDLPSAELDASGTHSPRARVFASITQSVASPRCQCK